MGLYPVDTDSSDEELFTGNVVWDEDKEGKEGKEDKAVKED
jgi:hypothetical protein